MKIIVTLAVVALLVIAAFFFFGAGSNELDIAPKQTPSADGAGANARQDYSALSNLLTRDMANIPVSLDAPRIAPASAFSVKSKLAGATALHTEYQTLTQVCDLIIFADQEHSVRQAQNQQAEQNIIGDPMASTKTNQLSATATRTSLHAKAQTDWETYRQQTDAEVRRLLATLPGVRS